MTGTLALLIFLATFAVVGGATWVAWRFAGLESSEPSLPDADDADQGILRSDRLSALTLLTEMLSRAGFTASLKRLLDEARVEWTVGRLVLTMLVTATISLAVMMRLDFVPWWGAIALSLGAGAVPIVHLRQKRAKRMREVEAQLPEALDFISRALVAGHSLPMSLELLAEEIGPPLATELRKTVDEYNMGASMDESLENLSLRAPSVDIQFFTSAIMTQSRTGGSLHELLETLSETIRERGTLRGQVRALTANGRMTALILSSLPVFIATVMYFISPDYMNLLLNHSVGKTLVFVAACSQVAAFFVIRRLVDIRV